ncbi:MAG: ATPase domain-containing protein [Candidatus Aenigmatarchaeota archaeon]
MKVKSGYKKLDNMLDGGLPANTNILVSGGPGTGKTLFSLKFLMEGLRAKERCCYISLSESKEELLRASKSVDSLKGLETYVGKNCAIEHITLGENITMKKFNEIIATYPKIDRLVIDNINKLLLFTDTKKAYRIHLAELLRHLKSVSKCTLLICETKADRIDTGNNEAFECDGIIHLSFSELEEKPMRMLQIHKLRYAAFEPRVPHELIISNKEIIVSDTKII